MADVVVHAIVHVIGRREAKSDGVNDYQHANARRAPVRDAAGAAWAVRGR